MTTPLWSLKSSIGILRHNAVAINKHNSQGFHLLFTLTLWFFNSKISYPKKTGNGNMVLHKHFHFFSLNGSLMYIHVHTGKKKKKAQWKLSRKKKFIMKNYTGPPPIPMSLRCSQRKLLSKCLVISIWLVLIS